MARVVVENNRSEPQWICNGELVRHEIDAHVHVDFEYGETGKALEYLTNAFEAARAELEAMLPTNTEPEPEEADEAEGYDRDGDPLVQEEIDRLVICHDSDGPSDEFDVDWSRDFQYIGGDADDWFVVRGYDVDDFKPAVEYDNLVLIHDDEYTTNGPLDDYADDDEDPIDFHGTFTLLGGGPNVGESGNWWLTTFDPADFKPVEAQFKVGQFVEGDDYDKLPVGAKFDSGIGGWEKRADGFYYIGLRASMTAGVDNGAANRAVQRRITYLPTPAR